MHDEKGHVMAGDSNVSAIVQMIGKFESDILTDWIDTLKATGVGVRIRETELREQCANVLASLVRAMQSGGNDVPGSSYRGLRDLLSGISASRATQGFTPSETATFVFSLKEPLFARLREEFGKDADTLADTIWTVTRLIDQLGLVTIEAFQKSREEVIVRQQQEIAELSTPVVKLWQGVVALPLIGTLDSVRTQVVMENLLQSIVDLNASIAIIDITGVPTVDTLVAQHLLKTVAAARLMGADCIVSGIRPQIAQTMVHLGVELNVVSKANLADAFALALRKLNKTIVNRPAVQG